jgi:hypothetical protein
MKDNDKSRRSRREPDEERTDDEQLTSPDADSEPALSDLSDPKVKKKLLGYTEEFQLLVSDQSTAAMNRRVQLTRLMRGCQDVMDAREPIVEVQVPRSVTGEPFQIGPATFYPGMHRVRSSVAHYLLWLIAENQRIEMNRLKSNGRNIDLGTIGSRARMATIARSDGDDDWTGRGR